MTRRRVRVVVGLLVVAVIVLNVEAYVQAGAMTRYVSSGGRTRKPEDLSLSEKLLVLVRGIKVPRPELQATPRDLGLPFETIFIDTRDGNRLEAWWVPGTETPPSGEPMRPPTEALFVLFHGYAAAKDQLLPVTRELVAMGHACLLVDFRGSGGSTGNETSVGYLEAEDVRATVARARELRPQARLVVYGFSMGAAAALRASHLGPLPVDALVLEAVFDTLPNTTRLRFRTMGLPPEPLASLLLFWGGRRWGFNAFEHAPVDYARSVTVPTLILQGEDDPRVTPEQAARVRDALAGPGLWSLYEEMGHALLVDGDASRWRDDIHRLMGALDDETR